MTRRGWGSRARAGSAGIAIAACVMLVATACSSTPSSDAGEVERGAQGAELGAVGQEPDASVEASAPAAEASAPAAEASAPAAEVEAVGDEAVADGAVGDEAVGSLFRGVRMCVKNERTTVDGRPATVSMQFQDADGDRGERVYLLPTAERCMDTGRGTLVADLVLMYTDATTLNLYGKNMPIGAVADVGPHDWWSCARVTSEGGSATYDNGDARYLLSRRNDSTNFKEYRLVIQDSQGKQGSCRGV